MSVDQTTVSWKEHLGLALISVFALGQFSLIETEVRSPLYLLVSFHVQVAVLFAGVCFFRRVQARCEEQPALIPVIVFTGIISLMAEPLLRLLPFGGSALEVVLIRALKNELLLFTMICCWRQYHPLMVVVSLFVFLFSMALSPTSGLTFVLMGLYLSATTFWLIARYLKRYAGTIHTTHRQHSLKRVLILGFIPVLMVVAFGPFANGRTIWSLDGFFATSGGEGGRDEFALGGIGNGDALVPGQENVQSFAPLDDAPFREDDKPSLYDSFSEEYGEPFKPTNKDRTIALPPKRTETLLPELAEEMKTMQQSGRQFSMLRDKVGNKRRDVESTTSKAIFHVVGRVPHHLRMETYDFYDGMQLIPGDHSTSSIKYVLKEHNEFHWLEAIENCAYDFFSPEESHVLKIVGIDSNIIPAPLHWTGIAIKDVNVRNFYEEGQYRVIHLDRDTLPELVPIHLRSRVLDERHFASARGLYSGVTQRYIAMPNTENMLPVIDLAREITVDCPLHRDKVSAVVQYMRNNYTVLDGRTTSVTEEEDSKALSITPFLFETRTGMDYEFATATMMLLRSLDIPCRVVSGYYADPENYDRKKDHTSVYAGDVHFWCEVYVGGNIWQTLEPTPGYEVLSPPLSVYERIEIAVLAAFHWTVRHWPAVTLAALLAVALLWKRRFVFAVTAKLYWKARCASLWVTAARPDRTLVLTRELLDRLLTLSGKRRPAGVPLGKWISDNYGLNEQESQYLSEFIRLLDETVYGGGVSANGYRGDPFLLSRNVARQFSWSKLRRV